LLPAPDYETASKDHQYWEGDSFYTEECLIQMNSKDGHRNIHCLDDVGGYHTSDRESHRHASSFAQILKLLANTPQTANHNKITNFITTTCMCQQQSSQI